MRFISFILCLLLLIQCSDNKTDVLKDNTFKIKWNWVDEFSDSDKEKLELWVRNTYSATQNTLGVFPFDVHVFFYQSKGDEPVPFAKASRKNNREELHFYVNPKYSLEEFESDWTAQHEMSHLSTSFLGQKNLWFSEGYATYLSRRIMVDQGYFTLQEFDSIYFNRIKACNNAFNDSTKTFCEVSDSLLKAYNYTYVYRGGSSFFYQIDKALNKRFGYSFADLVKKYQTQNRLIDKSFRDVLNSFDKIIGEPMMASLFEIYEKDPSNKAVSIFIN